MTTAVDQARGMLDQLGCWICSTHSMIYVLRNCNESLEIAAGITFSSLRHVTGSILL